MVRLFQPRVIELLYQHGADLTAKTRNGETPFGELLCALSESQSGYLHWVGDRIVLIWLILQVKPDQHAVITLNHHT